MPESFRGGSRRLQARQLSHHRAPEQGLQRPGWGEPVRHLCRLRPGPYRPIVAGRRTHRRPATDPWVPCCWTWSSLRRISNPHPVRPPPGASAPSPEREELNESVSGKIYGKHAAALKFGTCSDYKEVNLSIPSNTQAVPRCDFGRLVTRRTTP